MSEPNNHSTHEDTTTGLNHRKLLMWAFLGSDCMFFASLIATYLVYKGKSVTGPDPIDLFSIPVTSVSTFVLLMSSMSMVLAYAALTKGSLKGFRVWMLSTAIMGMTFLGFQVFEFRDFTVNEVIWLLSLFFYSFKRGAVSAERHLDVDLAALYWHFVDIVWIVIFTVVYLFGVYEGF